MISGAEVRSKSDGGDEQEDSNRDSNAITKSTNVVAAKEAAATTFCAVVHDRLEVVQAKKEGLGLRLEVRRRMVWYRSAMANGKESRLFGDSKLEKVNGKHERERERSDRVLIKGGYTFGGLSKEEGQ